MTLGTCSSKTKQGVSVPPEHANTATFLSFSFYIVDVGVTLCCSFANLLRMSNSYNLFRYDKQLSRSGIIASYSQLFPGHEIYCEA